MKVEEALDHIQRLHDSVSLQEAIKRARTMLRLANTSALKRYWLNKIQDLEDVSISRLGENMRRGK